MIIAERYELAEQAGVGSMGTVFRAIDTQSRDALDQDYKRFA